MNDPILPYFGILVRLDSNPQETSSMVMQSGLKMFAVVGTPSSPSGAVFVNDKRGTGKDANVRIVIKIVGGEKSKVDIAEYEPKQFVEFRRASKEQGKLIPMARAMGKIIPMLVATKKINPGDELLVDYQWTEEDWKNAIEQAGRQLKIVQAGK